MSRLEPPLWKQTPLIQSSSISRIIGCEAYLKLETLHPSQSFKYRGISYFIQRAISERGSSAHLVIASSGNAGLAAACVANALSVRCTVFIPDGASESTVTLLKEQNAEVVIGGKSYLHARNAARQMVDAEDNAVMVPSYDNTIVWEGHASMITEISAQLAEKPDAIFCSVGGGGLLGGIILGCRSVGWDDVPIVTLETIGSDCFYHSIQLNRNPSHSLPPYAKSVNDNEHGLELAFFNILPSRASGSLGASSPSAGVVKMALEREGGVKCASIPDELAMQVALAFADDHKLLVELACSTTLAPAYKCSFFAALLPQNVQRVVFIVDGGCKASLHELEQYRDIVDSSQDITDGSWNVLYNGDVVQVGK